MSFPPLPQEYADALNELTPEQAEEHRQSVEKALAAARELEVVKKRLDEQRVENEEKLRQENEGLLPLKFTYKCKSKENVNFELCNGRKLKTRSSVLQIIPDF